MVQIGGLIGEGAKEGIYSKCRLHCIKVNRAETSKAQVEGSLHIVEKKHYTA